MVKLKLGPIPDDKPVKVVIELPAALHRNLISYAEVLSRETGQHVDPAKLIAPMLARFMTSDRGFRAARRHSEPETTPVSQPLPVPGEKAP